MEETNHKYIEHKNTHINKNLGGLFYWITTKLLSELFEQFLIE